MSLSDIHINRLLAIKTQEFIQQASFSALQAAITSNEALVSVMEDVRAELDKANEGDLERVAEKIGQQVSEEQEGIIARADARVELSILYNTLLRQARERSYSAFIEQVTASVRAGACGSLSGDELTKITHLLVSTANTKHALKKKIEQLDGTEDSHRVEVSRLSIFLRWTLFSALVAAIFATFVLIVVAFHFIGPPALALLAVPLVLLLVLIYWNEKQNGTNDKATIAEESMPTDQNMSEMSCPDHDANMALLAGRDDTEPSDRVINVRAAEQDMSLNEARGDAPVVVTLQGANNSFFSLNSSSANIKSSLQDVVDSSDDDSVQDEEDSSDNDYDVRSSIK